MTYPTINTVDDLTAAIDCAATIDTLLLKLNAEITKLKEQRTETLAAVRERLQASGIGEAAGAFARVRLVETEVFGVDQTTGGWPALYARIQQTGEFDLLHKRLSNTAVRDRFNNGDILPGVKRAVLAEIKLTLL